MSIFDQIKADREAGTPGPWVQGGTLTHTSAFDHYDPFGPDGGSVACVCGEPDGEASERDVANARRIARVPQLERIALAAEGFADRFDTISQSIINGEPVDVQDLRAALVALVEFRDACK